MRTYLPHLRQALAPAEVTITRQGRRYLLDVPSDAVDLHRFRRLHASAREQQDASRALALVEAALALWHGEPLPEPDTPWAQDLRERLRRERVAAEADRVDWALRCGWHHDVLSELVTRADVDSWDERVAAQLMLALYRAGRQAEALEQYQRVRQRLADELGADPGPALQQMHQRILTADPGAGRPRVPRRGGHSRCTSRATARAAVVLHRPGARTHAAQQGFRGVRAGERHRLHQRDRRSGEDLAGVAVGLPEPRPVPGRPALRRPARIRAGGRLDRAAGRPARLPRSPRRRPRLYPRRRAGRCRAIPQRSRGKRTLIMLDNARDTEQVLPLLPGAPGCAILVTSRSQLDALAVSHGAKSLLLGVLADADAWRTARPRAAHRRTRGGRRNPRLCAGLSLALGIVAARADSVHAARPCGWPGHRAAGRSARETTAIVAELVTAHLLLEEHAPKRYKMHDLLRLYATELGPADPVALRGLVDFALHTTYTAERLLHPHRAPIDIGDPTLGGEEAAITWPETEYSFLLATQSLAARCDWVDPVWQLAWALAP
ncbi:AfsR/SARP family transcriptional regulator [Amycolatopsis sp. H6(2020)]|nr:AfsR/SARP family transcriptional regulator [Amycolatopsis sp. H6(2020)]